MRQCISPYQMLIATLLFLSTGRTYENLKFSTGIAAQTMGRFIPDTCKIIFEVLQEDFMKVPQTTEGWRKKSAEFKRKWHIINCGGCIDGKHVKIKAPAHSGSLYYNYKKFYSIVLMAIVDARYEFVYVEAGKPGKAADPSIFANTSFYKALQKGSLNLPDPEKGETEEGLNFIFLADSAFALEEHILKPFPQNSLNHERSVFNYRLSRGRNVVENAFGQMANIFRILFGQINIEPNKASYVVLAICVLHNYLKRGGKLRYDTELAGNQRTPAQPWRKGVPDLDDILVPLEQQPENDPLLKDPKTNREEYLKFFTGKGKVHWQDDMVKQGKA